MEVGIKYVVIKAGDDGTLKVGDHITLCKDGCLECKEAKGWLVAENVVPALKGTEVELDKAWAKNEKERLVREIQYLVDAYELTA